MKKLVLILSLAFVFSGLAQEIVQPIAGNPSLYQAKDVKVRSGNSLDSTFIYSTTNLDIQHVWDDFSEDRFVQYPPGYADANVTSQWYWCLMNSINTVPEPSNAVYCDSTKARIDSVFVLNGNPTTFTYYFTPHSIWVNDLNNYPITGGVVNDLYNECYVLTDTVFYNLTDTTYTHDSTSYVSNPTYAQDSIHLFFANLNDTLDIWLSNSACRNFTMAVDPWSLGVATFDGVDSTGLPYDFGNQNAYGEADVLTSKPINLFGTNFVYLDFLYQAQGHGNMPEPQDSLIVDFFLVDSGKWYPWWFASGTIVPNIWDTAHIPVPVNFLDDGFQFRIRNYASLSGALDHWHIDYVQLHENPLINVQNFKDLAISYPLNTLLEDYTAVPWDHYSNLADKEAVLVDTAYLKVYNSDATPTNVGSDMYLKIDYGVTPILNYSLPNPGAIPPWNSNWELGINSFPFFVQPNFTGSYVAAGNDSLAAFDVWIKADADVGGSNVYKSNDSAYFRQEFKNYYAYDDGSAEVAYGIQGSNAKLAYEFNAYEADTLTGILMHFVPSVNDVSTKVMLLTVWEDDNGEPGTILYQDDFFLPHYPTYGGSKNEFRYYEFVNPDFPSTIPVGQKFYVGWEQIDSESLNIGMDRNIVNNSKIFFNTGGSWNQSSQLGSLMIRPVFSTGINHTLGLEDAEETQSISMYPNPATDRLSFTGLEGNYTITIYDMSGRAVYSELNTTVVDIDFLQTGMYIVDIRNESGLSLFSDKLIKK